MSHLICYSFLTFFNIGGMGMYLVFLFNVGESLRTLYYKLASNKIWRFIYKNECVHGMDCEVWEGCEIVVFGC